MRAVQIREFGGPEVLELVDLPDPVPAAGEVLVEVARAGMNFADTHKRHNVYIQKSAEEQLPLIPGNEISGRVSEDGRRVAAILPGGAGGYAELVAVPEEALVLIPDGVSDDQAAAILIQGLTAWGLLRVSAKLGEGETVVVEGAAGGTGSLCVQLAKRMGARVIALASSDEKRALAVELGADAVADSRAEPEAMTAALLEANGGEPVDVVLQMSGGATFEAQMDALAPFGRMVAFGIASSEPNEVRTSRLLRTSRAVAGFWIPHLLARPDLLAAGISETLGAVASGELEVVIGGVHAMSDVARLQTDMAERRTHGKLLLDPSI
ncbi:MAG: zinc-binding dehydrogenase [Solirubrobacterales bacterium]|nr:zinc-binding dehydrogenase [Solirubrobacterales bacterium]